MRRPDRPHRMAMDGDLCLCRNQLARADIALIIALAYVIQLQTLAWCNEFVDRCFGSHQKAESPALAAKEA